MSYTNVVLDDVKSNMLARMLLNLSQEEGIISIMNTILTIREVTARLGIKKSHGYDLFHEGKLLGFRVGAAIRIYEQSVIDLINKHSNLPKTTKPAKPPQAKVGRGTRRSHSEEPQAFPLLGV